MSSWMIYNNDNMHEFEAINQLFSSINYHSEKSQDGSRDLKISTITDDKTKVEPRLLSSYLASQICTSQNMSQMNGSMKQATSIAPLTARDENRPPLHKTKFDLNRLAGSNSFKQSIFRETPKDSCTENHEFAKNSTLRGKAIRQNSRNSINYGKYLHKDEVESIIFDSKAVKTESFRSKAVEQMMKTFADSSERQVQKFQRKVAQVNSGIDSDISKVAKMIKQLRLLSLEKKIKAKEDKCKNMVDSHLFQSSIQEIAIPELQASQHQQQKQQISEKEASPSASRVELVGNFQSEQAALSQQFTMFVNRLCRQIHLDMEFTQMAAELYRSNALGSAKALIMSQFGNQCSNMNLSFLEMDPAEMDPLEKKPSSFIQLGPTDLQVESSKLFAKLQEIQMHFNRKLRKGFSPSIIAMLFQELSANSGARQKDIVTVGDLLSYINMRTSSSFRNRFFVKMMKRLSLKPSGPITQSALQLFTK